MIFVENLKNSETISKENKNHLESHDWETITVQVHTSMMYSCCGSQGRNWCSFSPSFTLYSTFLHPQLSPQHSLVTYLVVGPKLRP